MANSNDPKTNHDAPMIYAIRIEGHLGVEWSHWFGDLIIQKDGTDTLLIASLADQSALHGLLRKIRDLGITLLLVECISIDK